MAKNQLKLAGITLIGLGLFLGTSQVRAQAQQASTQSPAAPTPKHKGSGQHKRIQHMNRKVEKNVQSGKLTAQQGQAIQQQMQQDAAAHHGHITKQEKQQLKQEIKQDKAANKGGQPSPAAPAAQ